MNWLYFCGAAALASVAVHPADAQDLTMASANNPAAMVQLLAMAGYEPKLEKDSTGDPMIELMVSRFNVSIYFYGCDEKTHDGCDAVQFSAGFDRSKPWTAAEAIAISAKWRFAAVRLDDEGDPYVSWDVVTGDGIPSKVFLKGLLGYADTLDEASAMIFAEDGPNETAKQ